ncbi:MAG: peptide deformylase [Cytophagaceae bacterium]|nr:peptide deformylase [Cytophagaceae bacterium]
MKAQKVLLLGDPRLHDVSAPVVPHELPDLQPVIQDLHDILFEFKARFAHYGAFRGIAAPQIGVMKRLIYTHVEDVRRVLINPVLENMSPETFEVWDDCMCFPNLLVRVHRHQSLTVRYQDENGQEQTWSVAGSLSELIQHEYDHLDGILATQRAIDERSFRWRV